MCIAELGHRHGSKHQRQAMVSLLKELGVLLRVQAFRQNQVQQSTFTNSRRFAKKPQHEPLVGRVDRNRLISNPFYREHLAQRLIWQEHIMIAPPF
jgi:hypothetical protein